MPRCIIRRAICPRSASIRSSLLLAAARALTRRFRANIVLLEARDRIGGRIDTAFFSDGTAVDLGAAWVHGASPSNPLMALVKSDDELVATDYDHSNFYFEANGTDADGPVALPFDPATSEKLFDATWALHKQSQASLRRKPADAPREDDAPRPAAPPPRVGVLEG